MLDLNLAHTYAPVCVCVAKIGTLCALLYALKGLGIPAFNVHVILGCLLFLDRTYYKERIFNTNVMTAFVLFSVILNTERNIHNAEEIRPTPLLVFSNAIWGLVGVLALLRAHARVDCLKAMRFNPLLAASVMLVLHSFLFWPKESEVLVMCRIFDFFVLSTSWIYLFNARAMKPNEVYNATDCIVQFGHVLFTSLVASALFTTVFFIIFFLMSRRQIRTGLDTSYKMYLSDDDIEVNGGSSLYLRGSGLEGHGDGELGRQDSPRTPPTGAFTINGTWSESPHGVPYDESESVPHSKNVTIQGSRSKKEAVGIPRSGVHGGSSGIASDLNDEDRLLFEKAKGINVSAEDMALFQQCGDPACTVADWADCTGGTLCCSSAGFECYSQHEWYAQCRSSCDTATWDCTIIGPCADPDECADETHNCAFGAACTNTAGSFTCACNTGFTGNGTSCTDIDECTGATDNCDAVATCHNTLGSFVCECNAGYVNEDCNATCAGYDYTGLLGGTSTQSITTDCEWCQDIRSVDFGANGWIDLGTSNIGGDLSFSFFLYVHSYVTYGRFVTLQNSGDNFWAITILQNSVGRIYIATRDGTGAVNGACQANNAYFIPIGKWTHFMFTQQTTVSAWYMNGEAIDINCYNPFESNFHTTSRTETKLGVSSGAITQARISDFRVYSRALTSAEAANVFDGTNLYPSDVIAIAGLGCVDTCARMANTACVSPDGGDCGVDDNCHAQATCLDGGGSFTCTCNSGYETVDSGVTCTDIVNCGVDDNCHAQATCLDGAGSFTCTCNSGYETVDSGVTCTDIVNCGVDDNCHAQATCLDGAGSFTCTCNSGYETVDSGVTCTNADECAQSNALCSAANPCVATQSSQWSLGQDGSEAFNGDGYDGVWGDDACTHTADSGDDNPWLRIDLPSAAYVTSLHIYFRSSHNVRNEDFQIIVSDTSNTTELDDGGNLCYQYSGTPPVNTGSGLTVPCNMYGSYVWIHTEGKGALTVCELLIYPYYNNCSEDATCTNTAGSFTCTCNSGYETSDSGVTCTDIVNCGVDDNCDTQATCSDGAGSFTCTCNSGYTTSDSGVTCTDIVNCGVDDNCDTQATCSDGAGSFTCACNAGWIQDMMEVYSASPIRWWCGNGWYDIGLNNLPLGCVDIAGPQEALAWTGSGSWFPQDNMNPYTLDIDLKSIREITSIQFRSWAGVQEPGQFCVYESADGITFNGGVNIPSTSVGSLQTYSISPTMVTRYVRVQFNSTSDYHLTNLRSLDFGLADTDLTCYDINECILQAQMTCDRNYAECANTAGSFTCTCNSGYTTSDNGVTCTDIVNCGADDNCDTQATCLDGAGSFTCVCNLGYFGDGVICTDTNECAVSLLCGESAWCPADMSAYAFGGSPERSFDGLGKAGNYGSSGCMHSDSSQPDPVAWWRTNLTKLSVITSVHIWNRMDSCCDHNMNNFIIRVSTSPDFNTVYNDASTICYQHSGAVVTNETTPVAAPCSAVGNYIWIHRNAKVLQFCEVEVYGTDVCHPDASCNNTMGSFTCTCNRGYEDDCPCVGYDFNSGIIHNVAEQVSSCPSCVQQKGLSFNGVSSYVDAGGITTSTLTAMSISFWMYPEERAGAMFILSGEHQGVTGPLQLYIDTTSDYLTIVMEWWHGGVAENVVSPLMQYEKWLHVAISVTGTDLYVYYNASQVMTFSDASAFFFDGFSQMWVGDLYFASGNRFQGMIHDLRIHNKALSPAEVSDLHTGVDVFSSDIVALDNAICEKGCLGQPLGTKCIDIQECVTEVDDCDSNAICTNTAGSFTCSCNSGYSGDGVACSDINECTGETDNCATTAVCTNTIGSFTCACNSGYTTSDNGVTCTDIVNCGVDDNCDTQATCLDGSGSFTCTCNSGYTTSDNGVTCTDIVNCGVDDNCDTQATCLDGAGSFTCTCNSGYTTADNGVTCTDIVNCGVDDNCDTQATCLDGAGSFTCTCNSGYTTADNGVTCTDIVNCGVDDNCDTQATCLDGSGSFTCTCNSGYTTVDNGVTCTDIVNCGVNDNCADESICTDADGSFTCACIAGYTTVDNGVTCTSEYSCGDELGLGEGYLYHRVVDLPLSQHSWSSYWVAGPFLDGTLATKDAWCPASTSPTEYHQIDYGSVVRMEGIVMAGHDDAIQAYTRSFTARYSLDEVNWYDVDGGATFASNVNKYDFVPVYFAAHVYTRYLRVTHVLFTGHPCNRIAPIVLRCGDGCVNQTYPPYCDSNGFTCQNRPHDHYCVCPFGYSGDLCTGMDMSFKGYGTGVVESPLDGCPNCRGNTMVTFSAPTRFEAPGFLQTTFYTRNITLSMWVRISQHAGYFYYFDSRMPIPNNRAFYAQPTASNFVVNVANTLVTISSYTWPLNTWNHFCLTVDNSDVIRIYRDSVEIGTGSVALPGVYLWEFASVIGTGLYGDVADFIMYGRDLTAVEVLALYNGNGPTLANTPLIQLGECLTDACSDVNECMELVHNCDSSNAECSNTNGSFTCTCNAGYTTSDDGVTCTDIVNCDFDDNCANEATCLDGAGSFTCTCNSGYTTADNGVTCTDIVNCGDTDNCDPQATCLDGAGSFTCTCNSGYTTSDDGVTCTDIVNCDFDDNCDPQATCLDGAGSFTCTCNSGYTTSDNGVTCMDIVNCEVNDNCADEATCLDGSGSFTCTCNSGYTTSDNGVTCTDIVNCEVNDNCADEATCLDGSGSFTCTCNTGYTTSDDGVTCTDIVNCGDTDNCDTQATCLDGAGSFTCICNTGYETVDNGVTCTDIVNCGDTDNCDPQATCLDGAGSFTCTCNAGYTTSDNGVTCTDIVNCGVDDSCSDEATCLDGAGSFTCTCNSGYTTADNGVTCTDIVNCGDTDNCDPQATCLDGSGSFTCTCNSGYTTSDNGVTCTDIVNCEVNDNCADEATCLDGAGSFTCTCNSGYETVDNGVTCTDIVNCGDTDNCDSQATCLDGSGSFTCTCNIGWESDDNGVTCVSSYDCGEDLSVVEERMYERVVDIPLDQRSWSSYWLAGPFLDGRLITKDAWCPASTSTSEYHQIDYGSVVRMNGIVISGHDDTIQAYTRFFTVDFSIDGSSWSTVDNGAVFTGSTNKWDFVPVYFTEHVFARYLRVTHTLGGYVGHPCNRFAPIVLRCDNGCVNQSYAPVCGDYTDCHNQTHGHYCKCIPGYEGETCSGLDLSFKGYNNGVTEEPLSGCPKCRGDTMVTLVGQPRLYSPGFLQTAFYTGNFTLSMWVRISQHAGYFFYFDTRITFPGTYTFYVQPTATDLVISLPYGSATVSGYVWPLNTWAHFCLILDELNFVHVYKDGSEIGTGSTSGSDVFLWEFTSEVGTLLHGNIADFILYGRALDAAEVQTLYNGMGPSLETTPIIQLGDCLQGTCTKVKPCTTELNTCVANSTCIDGTGNNVTCPCDTGNYGDGFTLCEACPKGSYADETGMSSCKLCTHPYTTQDGITGANNVTECSTCVIGYWQDEHGMCQECSTCPFGYYTNSSCQTYSDTGCLPCPKTTTWGSANQTCDPCPPPLNVWEIVYSENYTTCHISCRGSALWTAVSSSDLQAAAARVSYPSEYDILELRTDSRVCLPVPKKIDATESLSIEVVSITETGWTITGFIRKRQFEGVVAYAWNALLDPYRVKLPRTNHPCVLDRTFCCLYDVSSWYVTGLQLATLSTYDSSACTETSPYRTWAADIGNRGAQLSLNELTWVTEWNSDATMGNVTVTIPFESVIMRGMAHCNWDNGLTLACDFALGVIFLTDVWKHDENVSMVLPYVEHRPIVFHYSAIASAIVTAQQHHTCIEQVSTTVYAPRDTDSQIVVLDVLFRDYNQTIGLNRTIIEDGAIISIGPKGRLQLATEYSVHVDAFPRNERIATITFTVNVTTGEIETWYSPVFDIRFPIRTGTCVEQAHVGGNLATSIQETANSNDDLRRIGDTFSNIQAWTVYGLRGGMVPVVDMDQMSWVAISDFQKQHTNSETGLIALILRTPKGHNATYVENMYVAQIRSCDNTIARSVALASNTEASMREMCKNYPRDCIATVAVVQRMAVARGWLLLDANPCDANGPAREFVRRTTGMTSSWGEMLVTHYLSKLCEIKIQKEATVHIVRTRQVRWPVQATSPDCIVLAGTVVERY